MIQRNDGKIPDFYRFNRFKRNVVIDSPEAVKIIIFTEQRMSFQQVVRADDQFMFAGGSGKFGGQRRPCQCAFRDQVPIPENRRPESEGTDPQTLSALLHFHFAAVICEAALIETQSHGIETAGHACD